METIPQILFVQANNCTCENKNRYLLSYFEFLVAMGVFVEAQLSFLPFGHTHTEIDQAFSTVALRLRTEDAFTMADLLRQLGSCYSPKASASQILFIAIYSGLREEQKYNNPIKGISMFRYFKFTRASRWKEGGKYDTVRHVKGLFPRP